MTCPYCKKDLGDLDPIMDSLKNDGYGSETEFGCPHCQGKIKASNRTGNYYIIATDPLPDGQDNTPLLIGAA